MSDYIQRWINDTPEGTWGLLKADLRTRYGEAADEEQARALMRKFRQQPRETVVMYAERLQQLFEDARRVNGIKGGNRKKSNKCNVKNLLEAIAALV